MACFLLIHGACHGAWCWRDLLPALAEAGHEARAIDLPGHGDDPAAPETVTHEDYVAAILAAAAPGTVLVGHSMAGFAISSAAEAAPERFARLVYLCAFVPRPGTSLADLRAEMTRRPLSGATVPAPDGRTFTVEPGQARALFLHDCPEAAADFALPRLCPEPVAPQRARVALGHRYASVPRSFVLCTEDRVLEPASQRAWSADFPPGDVHQLATGHSPFFADPAGLAALLDRIARQ